MKKRSHKNNPRRVTARERVHIRWVNGPTGRCGLDSGEKHSQMCDDVSQLLGRHARETLAREHRRDGGK